MPYDDRFTSGKLPVDNGVGLAPQPGPVQTVDYSRVEAPYALEAAGPGPADKDSILLPEPGDSVTLVEDANGKRLGENTDNNTPAQGTGGISGLYGPRFTGR